MKGTFRHYKDKDYKVLGVAKHSETLEDLVVYQCLYDNPLGSLWVRPRSLFEGRVLHGGQETLRFRPLEWLIQQDTTLSEELIQKTMDWSLKVFGSSHSMEKLWKVLNSSPKILMLTAHDGQEPIGFKLGYEESPGRFYSWLGGVDSGWRGKGVAQALMIHQHRWAQTQGYEWVTTKSRLDRKEMIVLNLKNGFEITAMESKTGARQKILFEKRLTSLKGKD